MQVATGDKLMQSLVLGAGAEVFSPDRIIEVTNDAHENYMFLKFSPMHKSSLSVLLRKEASYSGSFFFEAGGREFSWHDFCLKGSIS